MHVHELALLAAFSRSLSSGNTNTLADRRKLASCCVTFCLLISPSPTFLACCISGRPTIADSAATTDCLACRSTTGCLSVITSLLGKIWPLQSRNRAACGFEAPPATVSPVPGPTGRRVVRPTLLSRLAMVASPNASHGSKFSDFQRVCMPLGTLPGSTLSNLGTCRLNST
jgi:hypothetical protein